MTSSRRFPVEIVTAYHRIVIGERTQPVPFSGWGHPPGICTEQLVTVPWPVHDAGDQSEVTTDPPEREDSVIE